MQCLETPWSPMSTQSLSPLISTRAQVDGAKSGRLAPIWRLWNSALSTKCESVSASMASSSSVKGCARNSAMALASGSRCSRARYAALTSASFVLSKVSSARVVIVIGAFIDVRPRPEREGIRIRSEEGQGSFNRRGATVSPSMTIRTIATVRDQARCVGARPTAASMGRRRSTASGFNDRDADRLFRTQTGPTTGR